MTLVACPRRSPRLTAPAYLKMGTVALFWWLVPVQGANAADNALPEQPGASRTVALFNLFCHRQVPNLTRIAEIAASGGFTEILGAELEAYQPPVPAEELKAWRFADHGQDIVLTTAKSLPDAEFSKEVPAFADSINYACSLVIPVGEDGSAEISAEMVRLIGRSHDNSWDQPPLRAHVWCGSNETTYACTYFWAPVSPSGTGMLTSTLFVKN